MSKTNNIATEFGIWTLPASLGAVRLTIEQLHQNYVKFCSRKPAVPGFYLKCGSHWMSITKGHGCFWAHCSDASKADRFETREDAEEWQYKMASEPYGPECEIVEVRA